MNKVSLKIPGYKDIVFDSYENLNLIWEIIEEYPNCKIEVISKDDSKITENIENFNNKSNEAILNFSVPKKVTFTSRFQERVKNEIENILSSVYPDMFEISKISYEDFDENDMIMAINISAKNEKGISNLKYLDKNVEFILKDLIDYYL